MSLETKSLTELENIAAKLRERIRQNPGHCRIEQVELADVIQWIALRKREAQTKTEPMV